MIGYAFPSFSCILWWNLLYKLSYAILYFINLQNLGVPPDLTTYNILLKTCCNAREFNLAQEIYEEMMKKECDGFLKLDVFTYSTMMKVPHCF
jgi:pentatricopeptide repeat protein